MAEGEVFFCGVGVVRVQVQVRGLILVVLVLVLFQSWAEIWKCFDLVSLVYLGFGLALVLVRVVLVGEVFPRDSRPGSEIPD